MSEKTTAPLPALTGLRYLAAACIVAHHSYGAFGDPVNFGVRIWYEQAVTFFFVLSGFILAYNYPDLSRPGDWVRFWRARWARVWPAHVATFLLLIALVPGGQIAHAARPTRWALAANLALLQSWYPAWNSYFSYNAVSWSISTEWAFYLLFPVLITHWRKTWWLKLAATFACACAVIVSCNVSRLPFAAPGEWTITSQGWVYVNPLANLFPFTVGMALVPVFRSLQNRPPGKALATGLEVSALALVARWMATPSPLVRSLVFHHSDELGEAGVHWLIQGNASLPAFALLLLVMGLGRGWCSRVLGHPVMTTLGEMSFSLYLVHFPLKRWYQVQVGAASVQPNLFAFVGWIALSHGFAYLNWRFVERPCRRLLIGFWPARAEQPATPAVPARAAA